MRRTLEALFRHLFQLLTLLVLLPLIGVAVAYVTIPKKYQSTASLWALQRYQVIGATGVEGNLTATPAMTQSTALNGLLQTRTFVQSVVNGIDFVPTLHLSASVLNDPQQLQDAIVSEISKNVVAADQSTNLFQITYSNRNPQVAQKIIQAVITQFETQSLAISKLEGNNLLTSYQFDLQQAQKNDNTAVAAENQYLQAHPNLINGKVPLSSDPQYAQLDTVRVQAEDNVNNIQSSLDKLRQSLLTLGNDVTVIDQPLVAVRPQSRIKDYLVGGSGGLGVALLASVLFLVILARRDRTIYSTYDLQGDSLGVPVVMQLPHLKPALVSLVVVRGTTNQPLAISSKSSANGYGTR
ncbi:MAG: hypothetical protein ABI234_12480 [Ktedonobacteraceae bacterium]